jgi:hypothetical protein
VQVGLERYVDGSGSVVREAATLLGQEAARSLLAQGARELIAEATATASRNDARIRS